MRILIAEDDATSRKLLELLLARWGYEVVSKSDGNGAWEVLSSQEAPPLAILDWMMPGMDGVQICRSIRELDRSNPTYILLLTAKDRSEDIVTGLEAGADDYLTKPFDAGELRARVRVGIRIVEMRTHIKTLQGIIPICMYCHKIRRDEGSWQRLEAYVMEHTDAMLSHGMCPECLEEHHPLE